MKIRLGDLRMIIAESVLQELTSLDNTAEKTWEIVPGVKNPGLSVKPQMKPYTKGLLRNKLPVYSFIQVNDQFEKDLIEDGFAPEESDATPIKMVHAIKVDKPLTTPSGVTFVPNKNITERIVASSVNQAAAFLKGKRPQIVTAVESKSKLANMFGQALAEKIGARYIPNGLTKGAAKLNLHDKLSPASVKTISQSFDRAHIDGKFQMKKMHPSHRQMIDLDMQHSDELADTLTQPGEVRPSIVLVDDIVTSGSTLDSAVGAVNEYADVVAIMTIFKMKTGA